MKTDWKRYPLQGYPGEIWADWDRLNARYNDSHPMMDSRFVARLVEYFPAQIDVLVGRQNSEPVALLLVDSAGKLVPTLYRPSQIQLALAIVPREESLSFSGMLSALRFFAVRLDLYSLDPLYHALIITKMKERLESGAVNMVIDAEDSFTDYWSKRPKNLRKNVSRYSNRIQRDFGGYEFKVFTAESDMEAAVERYAAIESQGWKGKAGTALRPGNTQDAFYRDVMQAFARNGQAYVFEFWLGGQLASSRLCIANTEQLIILKTTYDEEYSNYAAGRILLYETVKYVFDNRISSRIDFYTNATREQLEWATGSREMYNLSMYKPAVRLLSKPFKIAKTLSRTDE